MSLHPPYVPNERDLRRARDAAQRLSELLEMADMDSEARAVRKIRDRVVYRIIQGLPR